MLCSDELLHRKSEKQPPPVCLLRQFVYYSKTKVSKSLWRCLIDPIGVQNPKTSKLASSTLLSNRSQVALELQLRNTLVLGLSIDNTLAHRPLPTPSAHPDPVHNIALQKTTPTNCT